MIKLLVIGDVFGKPGRDAVKAWVPRLREEHSLDLVVANCENAAQGRGVTQKMIHELREASVDFFTSGNHIWYQKDIYPYLNEKDCRVIRPANLPQSAPGKGWGIAETRTGLKVAVLNVMGQVFMNPSVGSPFDTVDELIGTAEQEADMIILDMHAETTSEKRGMGWYVDGRIQACFGTHTHVQTADEEVLPQGCAYISDLGMTGPYNSVIGMEKESVLRRFRTSLPVKFEVASGDTRFCGAIIEIDEHLKKATSIQRICERLPENS